MPTKLLTVVRRVIDILRLRREHPDWTHQQISAALPEAKLTPNGFAMVLDEIEPVRRVHRAPGGERHFVPLMFFFLGGPTKNENHGCAYSRRQQ
jgi:hypothetical protein